MRTRESDYSTADYDRLARFAQALRPEGDVTAEGLREADDEFEAPYVRRRFLVEQEGQLLAQGLFEHRHNMFDPQRFWLWLEVLPDYRRNGIGRALYDHMQVTAQSDHDANELHASALDSAEASVHFLQNRGFREIKRNWESHLRTAQFDWSAFDGLDAQMASLGVEIETLSDLMQRDDEALHKVYDLHQTLNQDVPSVVRHTWVDFDYWLDGYSANNPSFVPEANFVALREGAYIGLSGLWGDPSSGKIYTGMTGTRPAYRRQGIATALKLRGIAFAQTHAIPLLITHNKGENPMLLLNLKLGFVKQSSEIFFMKTL